jgi:hypothetical protein
VANADQIVTYLRSSSSLAWLFERNGWREQPDIGPGRWRPSDTASTACV